MRDWKQVRMATDLAIFRCDPHVPWKRPLEMRNQQEHQRAASPVLPKGTRPNSCTAVKP